MQPSPSPFRNIACDAGLLRRYDRPGPRYTSYPTAPQFGTGFGETALRQVIQETNAAAVPRTLSLYVHVPFCFSPCFYCGCNRIITRDRTRAETYLQRLHREISLVAPLFDHRRQVVQLHFGGGTPNFLEPAQLAGVVAALRQQFTFAGRADSDISIEIDPRFCPPDWLPALAAAGFNRASLGVQDFDPAVQQAVNRIQGIEETRRVVDACRDAGLRSVNIDLIYGLPGQDIEGFGRTLDIITRIRPDRLAVYGYAHMPHLFKPQKQIDAERLPDSETRLALLQLAIGKLSAAGYVYIGMDHFALPDDDLAQAQAHGGLHRNFMGYTTHAGSDLMAFGVSAISHIGASFSQNPRDLPSWEAAIDAGRLPAFRGMRLSSDDELRAGLIQSLMCQGTIPVRQIEERHGMRFTEYFAAELARLQPLADDGLVLIGPEQIEVTDHGRLLLRNIAMCFDRYLAPQPKDEKPRFSQAI